MREIVPIMRVNLPLVREIQRLVNPETPVTIITLLLVCNDVKSLWYYEHNITQAFGMPVMISYVLHRLQSDQGKALKIIGLIENDLMDWNTITVA